MNRIRFILAALLLAATSAASAASIEIQVNGLVCAFCAQGISKTLKAFPQTQDVFVSLEHRLVAVALKPGQDIADAELKRAITDAGYTTVDISRTPTSLDAIRERVRQQQADHE